MLIVLVPVALAIRDSASLALLLAAAADRLPVRVHAGSGADRGDAARLLPRRPADPDRGAAALVLHLGRAVQPPELELPGLSSHHLLEALLRWVNPIAPFIDAMRTVLYNGTSPSAATIVYVLAAAPWRSAPACSCSGAARASWRWSCEPRLPARSCSTTRGGRSRRAGDRGRTLKELVTGLGRGSACRAAADAGAGRRLAARRRPARPSGSSGRNGAGKTSTLRVLAGIIPLHRGFAGCGGRVATLIDLAAGFGREFTGRENIHLSAALHGMSRRRGRGADRRDHRLLGARPLHRRSDQDVLVGDAGAARVLRSPRTSRPTCC